MADIALLGPTLPADLKLVEVLRLLRLRRGRPDVPLNPYVLAYVLEGKSPRTIVHSEYALQLYLRRCADAARDPFDPDDIAEYLAESSALRGLSFGTAQNMLSQIAVAGDCLGLSPNPARDPLVLETLRGIGRVHGRRRTHVMPLWAVDLKAMAMAVRFEPNEALAIRNIAFLTFLRGSGLRRLTAVGLQLSNILSIDHRGVEYWPGPTKADQLGLRGPRKVGRTSEPLTDPVLNLERLLAIRGTDLDGALFPSLDKNGRVQLEKTRTGVRVAGLTTMQAYNIVVYHCGLVGLPVEHFAVHSTRRGLGSEATANGVPEIVTMNELGHASYDTFADYVSLRGNEAYAIAERSGL
jgi:hypothetical protein